MRFHTRSKRHSLSANARRQTSCSRPSNSCRPASSRPTSPPPPTASAPASPAPTQAPTKSSPPQPPSYESSNFPSNSQSPNSNTPNGSPHRTAPKTHNNCSQKHAPPSSSYRQHPGSNERHKQPPPDANPKPRSPKNARDQDPAFILLQGLKLDVVEEVSARSLGRRAVDEEHELLVPLVPHLQGRHRLHCDH